MVLVISRCGSNVGEVQDLPPVIAAAMLADGRAELINAAGSLVGEEVGISPPAIGEQREVPDVALRSDRVEPKTKRRRTR